MNGSGWYQQDSLLNEETDAYTLLAGGSESSREVEEFTIGTTGNAFTVIRTQIGAFGTKMVNMEMIRVTAEERKEIQRMVAQACPWKKCIFGKDAWVRWQIRWMAILLKLYEPGKTTEEAPLHMPGASTPEGIY